MWSFINNNNSVLLMLNVDDLDDDAAFYKTWLKYNLKETRHIFSQKHSEAN